MPKKPSARQRYLAMFGEEPPGYMSKADSIEAGLQPKATQESDALRRLVDANAISQAKMDSTIAKLGGDKKTLSDWEQSYDRVYNQGTGTLADSLKLGIAEKAGQLVKLTDWQLADERVRSGRGTAADSVKLGTRPRETAEKGPNRGTTPWYYLEEWKGTPEGRRAQISDLMRLRKENRDTIGDVIDLDLEKTINEQIKVLTTKQQGITREQAIDELRRRGKIK